MRTDRPRDDAACIVNAAWALTSICASRPTDATVVGVTTRPDVFVHLSALLRAEFPRHDEKAAVFANLCRMLAPVVSKVWMMGMGGYSSRSAQLAGTPTRRK